jgi:ribosomal-protein-serine acetyltransferase
LGFGPLQAFKFTAVTDKIRSKFLNWIHLIKTVNDEKQFVRASHRGWREFKKFDFGIFRKSDGVYMGTIGLHSVRWDRYSCEIGYWILGDFEGKGYISEAVRVLEATFFKMGFNRIQICCNSNNKRSARVPLVFGKLKKEWMKSKR